MDCPDYAFYVAGLACVLPNRALSEPAIFKDTLGKEVAVPHSSPAAHPINRASGDVPGVLGHDRIQRQEAADSGKDANLRLLRCKQVTACDSGRLLPAPRCRQRD